MVRDGQTGLVVPPQDPAAMARAVARLLEDPESAAAMARRARAEVEAYSWERVSRQWSEAYRGVAA
jgi:glycosyltransferase involved in cell wall biosynthesis